MKFLTSSRRDFLKTVAGLAVSGKSLARTHGPLQRPVLIVGGGLAGLAVLDALKAAGRQAVLFEASPRVGGRILTIRDGLEPGLRAEAGGEQVMRSHQRVRRLAGDLRIPLIDYPFLQGDLVFRHRGRMVRFRLPSDLPADLTDGLSPLEKTRWPFRLHLAYTENADPVADDDPRSALQWLRDLGISRRGETFVRAFAAVDPEQTSAAHFLRIVRREAAGGNSQVLAGGSDRLTEALAARHAQSIRRNTPIRTVMIGENTATLLDAGGVAHVADQVVLALPLGPLLSLDYRPGQPRWLSRWGEARVVAHELKVHAQVDAQEFAALGIRQHIMGFGFPRMTWLLPEHSANGKAVLNATAVNRQLPLLQEARFSGVQAMDRLLRQRLPLLRTVEVTTRGEDWVTNPLIGGAYTYVPAGSWGSPPVLREGPLVLAGSDYSDYSGWMEGALQSAEAAVTEILR
ncbi:flavin monoamine oxidase family protein [Sedimenticola hydrogenitrophicus]|uniref:flavin monoamine oxidase family protein n=1 Tax=Sedimenticola hydrogenitrophicus TaxID=2967975 RepID=UPI0023B0119A|nr:FAD-dependent oxidoreductase [Sedimenticola hydrogenitrophicus]